MGRLGGRRRGVVKQWRRKKETRERAERRKNSKQVPKFFLSLLFFSALKTHALVGLFREKARVQK